METPYFQKSPFLKVYQILKSIHNLGEPLCCDVSCTLVSKTFCSRLPLHKRRLIKGSPSEAPKLLDTAGLAR